ncbi:MAG: glycosyltransferase [Pseudomonadota bacterium]
MIAFHVPPQRGSSGIQRTLKFTQHLPALGWQPLLLSAHPRAYEERTNDQLGDIAPSMVVRRAFALDSARHLAIGGRYASWTALPDRWISWWFGAVPAGLAMVRRHRPAVLWSTYPIVTAHLIGMTLQRLTGLPWVADMRDPMMDDDYPAGRLKRWLWRWIERQTVQRCTRAVCTTPGALALYRARFPLLPADRFCLIENGYDEEDFADAELLEGAVRASGGPFVLLHSGIIYPSERDPRPLFGALGALRALGALAPVNFQLRLRAPVHEEYLRALAQEHGISDLVQIAPALPYRAALAEMLAADGLLLLQASNCNQQIPAKLYEYLRARRPILALTDPLGDTAGVLRTAGIDTVAALDAQPAIMAALQRFLALSHEQRAPLASAQTIAANSRQARSTQLATLLDGLQCTAP